MLKKSMLVFALLAFGCGEEKSDDTPKQTGNGSEAAKDASTKDARGSSNDADSDTGSTSVNDGGTKPANNGEPPPIDDAGSIEVKAPDGGSVIITPGADGGPQLSGMGSCCEAHDTPGCNNADLMVCVCEKNKDCCTKAWTTNCVLTVTEKFCHDDLRDCVCGTWGAKECCDKEWTDSCDVIGVKKCGQVPGCF